MKKIKSALISVFHKEGLEEIIRKLDSLNVEIYSTGGTLEFIEELGIKAKSVESLTGYPSIFGGRVKTLHPKVMGGILNRRNNDKDNLECEKYEIPQIDLVIVDLYPFEKTVSSNASEEEIIEKIDIGGISLIRAAAKNFEDVLIVPSMDNYPELLEILNRDEAKTDLETRRRFMTYAFMVSSHYDTAIFKYFNQKTMLPVFKQSYLEPRVLRYGENPHQKGKFFGDFKSVFTQLNGKEISYNNILDIDAACSLIDDFQETTFAIIKHNNACGIASREGVKQAYLSALQADPISAFGGVLVTNRAIDLDTAEEINKLFMEILIAEDYTSEALELLKSKKNRIILKRNPRKDTKFQYRSALGGVLVQERDSVVEDSSSFKSVTSVELDKNIIRDLAFANKIVKHTKSNAIVLVKDSMLLASGTGQTSRVDALNQAIHKAKAFGFELKGSVMASDAFFPFPDCVEIAHNAGVISVIHPGGSINDDKSIEYCQKNNMSMVITGYRHFKH